MDTGSAPPPPRFHCFVGHGDDIDEWYWQAWRQRGQVERDDKRTQYFCGWADTREEAMRAALDAVRDDGSR